MKCLLLLFQLVAAVYGGDVSCYDHQATDYKAQFSPAECNQRCTVTPYFSPDHSLDTYLDLIQSATESIDIYTPGELQIQIVYLCQLGYRIEAMCVVQANGSQLKNQIVVK